MTVSAIYAEEHFAELLAAASNGEEVEIAVKDKLNVKLVLAPPALTAPTNGRRILGAGRGELRVPSEEEWREFKKTMAQHIVDTPLLDTGEI